MNVNRHRIALYKLRQSLYMVAVCVRQKNGVRRVGVFLNFGAYAFCLACRVVDDAMGAVDTYKIAVGHTVSEYKRMNFHERSSLDFFFIIAFCT